MELPKLSITFQIEIENNQCNCGKTDNDKHILSCNLIGTTVNAAMIDHLHVRIIYYIRVCKKFSE